MKLEVVKKEVKDGKKREYRVDVKYNNKVINVKVDKSRFFRAEEGKLVNITHNELREGVENE